MQVWDATKLSNPSYFSPCDLAFQKSGYLYKKGAQSSTWQQRQVALSIDSGTMKFFAEKSG